MRIPMHVFIRLSRDSTPRIGSTSNLEGRRIRNCSRDSSFSPVYSWIIDDLRAMKYK